MKVKKNWEYVCLVTIKKTNKSIDDDCSNRVMTYSGGVYRGGVCVCVCVCRGWCRGLRIQFKSFELLLSMSRYPVLIGQICVERKGSTCTLLYKMPPSISKNFVTSYKDVYSKTKQQTSKAWLFV